MSRRRSLAAAALPLVALLLASGCKKKEEASVDAAAPVDAGATAAVVDAGPAPLPTPSNEGSIARFGDETELNHVAATVAAAHTTARSAAPGGTIIATLTKGTAVNEIAQRGGFVLVAFADPKDPTKALEGWVGESAFKSVPPPPPVKGSCPAKQSHFVQDDQFFCAQGCKVDGDCPKGDKCSGSANTYIDGKEGAATSFCVGPAGASHADGGAAAPKGPTIKDVQMPPDATGKCAAGYALATDGECHKLCPHDKADCPNPQSKCTTKLTADKLGVCQSTAAN